MKTRNTTNGDDKAMATMNFFRFALASLVSVLSLSIFGLVYNRPFGDDFCFAVISRGYNILDTFGILHFLYNTTDGRISSHLLLTKSHQIFEQGGEFNAIQLLSQSIAFFTPVFIFFIFWFSYHTIFQENKSAKVLSLVASICSFLLLLHGNNSLIENLYQPHMVIQYTIPVLLLVLLVHRTIRYERALTILDIIYLGILSVFISLFNETIALVVVFYSMVYYLSAIQGKIAKIQTFLTVFISSTVAFVVMYVAPGALVRKSNLGETGWLNILYSLPEVVLRVIQAYFFNSAVIIVVLATMFISSIYLAPFLNNKNTQELKRLGLVFIITAAFWVIVSAIVLLRLNYTIETTPFRVFFGSYALLSVGLISLILAHTEMYKNVFLQINSTKTGRITMFITSVVLVALFYSIDTGDRINSYNIKKMQNYQQWYDTSLIPAIRKSVGNHNSVNIDTPIEYDHKAVPNNSSEFWVNQCTAWYFNYSSLSTR